MSEEEKQLQGHLYEFRMLEERMKEISAQGETIIRALIETRGGLSTLKGLSTSSSTEVLVPIGGGIFVDAKAPPSDKFLVTIGADVIIEKPKEDALKYVEDRINEMENAVSGIEAHKTDINRKMLSKRESINEMIAKQKGQ
ncbi:MAG TPA: prefoldin subunit alpha [Nitrososphaerales archaeon]|jgi:prefoldin alpha subunit|nr:prefoldin subunit alpha [Nitrososphaerales archaeon]|tara:strand:- start:17208 stop:17630 length:423 start_codon:yes stop_codon:yes gene_type:complete